MEEEEQEDNEHVFPRMLASDALKSLYKLQLHEQQQVDANQGLIQLLRHHERGFFCEESKKGSNRLIYDTIFIRLYSTFVENIYVGYKSNCLAMELCTEYLIRPQKAALAKSELSKGKKDLLSSSLPRFLFFNALSIVLWAWPWSEPDTYKFSRILYV